MPDDVKTASPTAIEVKRAAPQAAAWPEAWNAVFWPTAEMNRRAFECWARGMSALSHDLAQFLQSRLLEDSTMWEKLATCRDPADAFACQSKFAAQAGADYAEAAQKFSRLMLDIAGSCGTGLRHFPARTG